MDHTGRCDEEDSCRNSKTVAYIEGLAGYTATDDARSQNNDGGSSACPAVYEDVGHRAVVVMAIVIVATRDYKDPSPSRKYSTLQDHVDVLSCASIFGECEDVGRLSEPTINRRNQIRN
jgi:hypothetical protein